MSIDLGQRWILALGGVLTEVNGDDHERLGGGDLPEGGEAAAGTLRDAWGIRTARDVAERLEGLLGKERYAYPGWEITGSGEDGVAVDGARALLMEVRIDGAGTVGVGAVDGAEVSLGRCRITGSAHDAVYAAGAHVSLVDCEVIAGDGAALFAGAAGVITVAGTRVTGDERRDDDGVIRHVPSAE